MPAGKVEQGVYECLDPRGHTPEKAEIPLTAPRLDSLEGKNVLVVEREVDPNVVPAVRDELLRQVPSANVIYWEGQKKGDVSVEQAKEMKVDAVIIGNGFWTNAVIPVGDTAKRMEQGGIPSVGIAFHDMTGRVENYKRDIAMPGLRIVIIPHISSPQKSRAYAPELVPRLLAALTAPLTPEEKSVGTIPREEFPRICCKGTFDQCQEYFQGDVEWNAQFATNPVARLTEGRPIILPTEERVERMLTGTSHKPDELVGPKLIPYDQKEFTVETVAINAVMAGCKPEYMPVLLAFAELKSTPPKTRVVPLVKNPAQFMCVVSGPIAKELGMNTERFNGKGVRANASMRSAMYLISYNAIGLGAPWGPGFYSSDFVFAEDIESSPWPPLGVDTGFKPSENVLLWGFGGAGAAVSLRPSLYRSFEDKMKLLETIAAHLQGGAGFAATIILYPRMAKDLAVSGMSKEDIKKWLCEHVTSTIANLKRSEGPLSQIRPGPFQRTEILQLPDDAVISRYKSPDMIQIIVAGTLEERVYVFGSLQWMPSETMTSIDKWR